MNLRRPSTDEYAPYFQRYIDQVMGSDILGQMKDQSFIESLDTLSPVQWAYRYAPEKWSVKQVIKHLSDSERVFAYRALRIGRNDMTPLPGFDQDDYTESARADGQSSTALMRELGNVRAATIDLFESYDEEAINRVGLAGEAPTSVLALGFMIIGHQNHHIKLFKELYGLWQ